MKFPFFKFQGAGNDFVLIDGLTDAAPKLSNQQINLICDRKFGIGADGLIILRPSERHHFEMEYYNADGNIGSLCGNGSRCAVHFYAEHYQSQERYAFLAVDGVHQASYCSEGASILMLAENQVNITSPQQNHFVIDTGSPHYLIFTDKIKTLNVDQLGKEIRFSERYEKEGINVNFVEVTQSGLHVRTYERGVEAETLACGTAAVAAAICHSMLTNTVLDNCILYFPGGQLDVSLREGNYWLSGPSQNTFVGSWETS